MNRIRREALNGLFVLVLSTLLSAAVAAFQLKFNLQVWAFIVEGVAIAVSGYVLFEIALAFMASTEAREMEWLKRVGTPARMELNREGEPAGLVAIGEALKTIKPGSDYTVMYYVAGDEGIALWKETSAVAVREKTFSQVLEQLKVGTIREYKRLVCFDDDVLASDPELKSGILRVGEGPGTISRQMGEHCRRMMETKGCSLYVAPAVLRFIVLLFGIDKVAITVDTAERIGGRTAVGVIFFSDPPNGEIIEQFRQMERVTERRMVAVREIRFPEEGPIAKVASS